MAGKKGLKEKIRWLNVQNSEHVDDLEKKDEVIGNLEGQIGMLRKQIEKLHKPKGYVEFGVMLVDMPLGLGKEKTDELLKPIQERMNEQMKSIGVDMPIIIMQGSVKSFNTYMIDSVKKVE